MSESLEDYKRRIARSGGYGRAEKLTKKQRHESAKKAAQARWAKTRDLVDQITEGTKSPEKTVKRKQRRRR